MYIRHIDHRSGAPWGPHGREGGKKFSRQSRDNFFSGKRVPWGGPRGGPMGGPGAWGPMGGPGAWASRTRGAPWGSRGGGPGGLGGAVHAFFLIGVYNCFTILLSVFISFYTFFEVRQYRIFKKIGRFRDQFWSRQIFA